MPHFAEDAFEERGAPERGTPAALGARAGATGWIERCAELFERADAATRELALRTGLACPPGCGSCCDSPEVETTLAEMRPMAAALVEAGRANAILEQLARRDAAGDRRCALYEPEAADPRRGRCGAYAHRPLVCRLFGFSARHDRHGRPELVACGVMREAEPETVERARDAVRRGAPASTFGDHVRALAAERPGEGARQLPIDAALRLALEAELLARRMVALESDVDPGAGDGPPGARPGRPRRAA